MKYNRKELLDYINVVSFAVNEATLYLDTHPEDEKALEYFHNYQRARNQALQEYAKSFTPLNLDSSDMKQQFTWATSSWPWQWEG